MSYTVRNSRNHHYQEKEISITDCVCVCLGVGCILF